MAKARIGFIGVGAMGQCAHLRNFLLAKDCEVVALAELREELGRRVAARFNIPRAYKSHQELLASEELDGLVASQPFQFHGHLVAELLKKQVPVFIEKPLCRSVAAGEKLAAAARASGTWMMLGYHKRCDAAVVAARRMAREERLGRLRYARILMAGGDWRANGFDGLVTSEESYPQLEADSEDSGLSPTYEKGYEAFVNFYIHQVNLLRHLIGEDYAVTHADPSGVLLAAQSRSGVACVLEMAPYGGMQHWDERVYLGFERGRVELKLPAPLALNRASELSIFTSVDGFAEPCEVRPELPEEHAMKRQAAAFVRGIREGRPPEEGCGAEEALKDLYVSRDYLNLQGKR